MTPGVRDGVRPGSWFHAHRVLRADPRVDAGRRPRRGDRHRQLERLRAHRGHPHARPRRDRAMGDASRSATATSTAPSPGRSCAGSRSGAGSGARSGRAPRPAARTTSCSSVAGRRPTIRRRLRRAVARALRRRARRDRPVLRGQHLPVSASPHGSVYASPPARPPPTCDWRSERRTSPASRSRPRGWRRDRLGVRRADVDARRSSGFAWSARRRPRSSASGGGRRHPRRR